MTISVSATTIYFMIEILAHKPQSIIHNRLIDFAQRHGLVVMSKFYLCYLIDCGLAAQSWCLFMKNTFEIIFSSAASVAAHPSYITSYRPEACSILAAASFLSILASTIDMPKTHVIFFQTTTRR